MSPITMAQICPMAGIVKDLDRVVAELKVIKIKARASGIETDTIDAMLISVEAAQIDFDRAIRIAYAEVDE